MLSLNDALHNYKKKKEEKKRVNNLLKYSPAFEIELDSFAMSAGKCGYLLFHPNGPFHCSSVSKEYPQRPRFRLDFDSGDA